jgi:hypothetical protein
MGQALMCMCAPCVHCAMLRAQLARGTARGPTSPYGDDPGRPLVHKAMLFLFAVGASSDSEPC